MKDWEVEDWFWFGTFLLAFLVALVGISSIVIDHRVRNYYMGPPMDGIYTGTTCVMADNPWEGDDKVYCSTDPQKTLEFMRQANAGLAGRK